jgi:hypothetical protein
MSKDNLVKVFATIGFLALFLLLFGIKTAILLFDPVLWSGALLGAFASRKLTRNKQLMWAFLGALCLNVLFVIVFDLKFTIGRIVISGIMALGAQKVISKYSSKVFSGRKSSAGNMLGSIPNIEMAKLASMAQAAIGATGSFLRPIKEAIERKIAEDLANQDLEERQKDEALKDESSNEHVIAAFCMRLAQARLAIFKVEESTQDSCVRMVIRCLVVSATLAGWARSKIDIFQIEKALDTHELSAVFTLEPEHEKPFFLALYAVCDVFSSHSKEDFGMLTMMTMTEVLGKQRVIAFGGSYEKLRTREALDEFPDEFYGFLEEIGKEYNEKNNAEALSSIRENTLTWILNYELQNEDEKTEIMIIAKMLAQINEDILSVNQSLFETENRLSEKSIIHSSETAENTKTDKKFNKARQDKTAESSPSFIGKGRIVLSFNKSLAELGLGSRGLTSTVPSWFRELAIQTCVCGYSPKLAATKIYHVYTSDLTVFPIDFKLDEELKSEEKINEWVSNGEILFNPYDHIEVLLNERRRIDSSIDSNNISGSSETEMDIFDRYLFLFLEQKYSAKGRQLGLGWTDEPEQTMALISKLSV